MVIRVGGVWTESGVSGRGSLTQLMVCPPLAFERGSPLGRGPLVPRPDDTSSWTGPRRRVQELLGRTQNFSGIYPSTGLGS